MTLPCGCRPGYGQSCRQCDGTDDHPGIAAYEDRRDWGSDDDTDRAERAYEFYLFGDAA